MVSIILKQVIFAPLFIDERVRAAPSVEAVGRSGNRLVGWCATIAEDERAQFPLVVEGMLARLLNGAGSCD